jgi:hypothetical protein
MSDDAIREVHGCRTVGGKTVTAMETEAFIVLESMGTRELTPWQARYLASKLYRLSRRVRSRTEAMKEAQA